ncbi:helix-turn-helix domain-containing protein [Paenibacillus athensensis]|uniref:helix-turn-helix domain-containing protein n=1 Tax=Paenibacillus athensensis TaxID=1967502 RepID=UPI001E2B73D7|nr:MerR family transcriptional regulator [Paenibacillus athensensis]
MRSCLVPGLAARAEVNASTLRYYESVGLLEPPVRRNGQRRYDEQLLERIHFIKIAQQTGFSVQEMVVMLEGLEAGAPLSEAWERMAQLSAPNWKSANIKSSRCCIFWTTD